MTQIFQKVASRILDRITSPLYRRLKLHDEKMIEKENALIIKSLKACGRDSFFWGRVNVFGAENIEIGQNVHIGDNAYIVGDGGLSIGDNTHISRNLTLYTSNHDYNGKALPYDENRIYKPVSIGKNVWIGMNVCIAPGSVIGDGCIIGIGAVISGNIPPLSIVGNSKPSIIKERDEQHYISLDNQGFYGGPNGVLYHGQISDNISDFYRSARSKVEKVQRDGIVYIKKIYNDANDPCFKNELEAIKLFKDYEWFPQVLETGENYIIREYYGPENRLDVYYRNNKHLRTELLHKLLSAVSDIYVNGYAHRDLHVKNIFISNGQIRIIDFETFRAFDTPVDFFTSYDITGIGMESPLTTHNMCIMKTDSEWSIGSVFGISGVSELKSLLEDALKGEILKYTVSFQGRGVTADSNGRVELSKKNMYSTFNLKYLTVNEQEGQRNIKKRLEQFGIAHNDIAGKTLIDIGCNVGGMIFGVVKFGPKSCLGVEYDTEKVRLANKIARINALNNVNVIQGDIDNKNFVEGIGMKADVVFCFAVIEHINEKMKLLQDLYNLCLSTLYFEGNANTDIQFVENGLKQAGFKTVRYLGFSNDEKNKANNVRPLFIATK